MGCFYSEASIYLSGGVVTVLSLLRKLLVVMQWLVGAVELLIIVIAGHLMIMGDYDVSDFTDKGRCQKTRFCLGLCPKHRTHPPTAHVWDSTK